MLNVSGFFFFLIVSRIKCASLGYCPADQIIVSRAVCLFVCVCGENKQLENKSHTVVRPPALFIRHVHTTWLLPVRVC